MDIFMRPGFQRLVGAELTMDSHERLIQAIRNGARDTAGQQSVQCQSQVRPTLTIRPGIPMRVIVTHDLPSNPMEAEPTP